jgi:exodeoxyribonuclease VII large subunit
VPVVLLPAAVQGAHAPIELAAALRSAYRLAEAGKLDVILLVRGGGSLEDLWAFNDEQLARAIVQSPVPLVTGLGHETDFTIADFCADLRAPTPTAAAELAAQSRQAWLDDLQAQQERLQRAVARRLDTAAQRLDQAAARVGRPSARLAQQQLRLGRCAHRLQHAVALRLQRAQGDLSQSLRGLQAARQQRLAAGHQAVDRLALRLRLLDPKLVLERGYALLTDERGKPVTSVRHTHEGQALRAALADGEVALRVSRKAADSSLESAPSDP